MRGLAAVLAAGALYAAYRGYVAVGAGLYGWSTLAAALLMVAIVALDVDRFRRLKSATPFETSLGRSLLAICATAAVPATIGGFQSDPGLFFFLIFCGGFGFFGAIFRFAIGKPDVSRTYGARKARKERNLTGDLSWRDGRIEEVAAAGRISPWPGRALTAIGTLLLATGALQFGVVALAGAVFLAFGLGLIALRRRSMPHGVSVFAPNQTPILLKKGVGGALVTPRAPGAPIEVALTCVERRFAMREDGSGAKGVTLTTLWEGVSRVEDGAVAFLPPADLPPSKATGDRRVSWMLTATAPGYRATFRLPVTS